MQGQGPLPCIELQRLSSCVELSAICQSWATWQLSDICQLSGCCQLSASEGGQSECCLVGGQARVLGHRQVVRRWHLAMAPGRRQARRYGVLN